MGHTGWPGLGRIVGEDGEEGGLVARRRACERRVRTRERERDGEEGEGQHHGSSTQLDSLRPACSSPSPQVPLIPLRALFVFDSGRTVDPVCAGHEKRRVLSRQR